MQKLKKEQQQVVILLVVLAIIVGVLVWFYRDKFLPHPTGEAALLAPFVRITIPFPGAATCQDDKTVCSQNKDCEKLEGSALCTYPLYKREDFKGLKRFADVPVRALQTDGSPEPFITDTKQVP